MVRRWLLRIAVVVVVFFLTIQVIPSGQSRSNPLGERQMLANGLGGAIGGGR